MIVEWRIRVAENEDAELIAESNRKLALETEGLYLDEKTALAGAKAVLTDEAKGQYFLALVDGRPVGQLLVTHEWSDWRNGFFWWIQSVYVEADYRRKGLLGALHRHVKELAQQRKDVVGIRLYVDSKNQRAQAAYQRLGMGLRPYLIYEQSLESSKTESLHDEKDR